ncbi:amidohydrolase family protein [Brevundimonas faecalis]|uniref:Cytosine/adenosine deaminase-related metal-dependent hydrolase n=1 Tax=Brevundimonas faecalis TaxID=947378 RepID=A0ABV2R9S5_9CAUL
MAKRITGTAPTAILAAALALLAGGQAEAREATTPAALAITGRIIDGGGGAPIEGGRVVAVDGMIACVGTAAACPIPDGAQVVDAGAGSVMPGLIDLHAHPRPHYYGWFLAAGVTTVRSANTDLAMVRALDAMPAPRARLVWAGPMLDGDKSIIRRFYPEAAPDAPSPARPADGPSLEGIELLIAQTPDQAVAAVDALAAGGAHWVKLYEHLPPDAFAAAVRRAREKGLPVMADLGMASTRGLDGAEVDLMQAAALGLDSLEHVGGAALAYRRLGGDLEAETLDPVLIDRMARALLASDTALVPTLSVFHFNADDAPPREALAGLPLAEAAGTVRDGLEQQWRGVHGHFHGDPAHNGKARLDARIGAAVTLRLAELGGRVGAGSDTPAGAYNLPGGGLHLELELMTRAGLTPLQALSAATGTAADILKRPDIGRIAVGRRADLVVVDGDPSRDVRDTRRLRRVILDGRVLDPQALQADALADGETRLAALMAEETD